ncbi:Lysine-specific histone demethylase 1A [Perkinsus chesapeaki]|uniref:Lysine-specific histone demethylase 1A n=1 Tax=Perkinsus chesapeaki TaxID=330153 RepID=A0A7J6MJI1_PERCH|nr:Lysine-specific histone demethylase 1A [Perkinsus chesapeaki]
MYFVARDDRRPGLLAAGLSGDYLVAMRALGAGSDTVWHPINHHSDEEERQRMMHQFGGAQTLPGFPSLKANPLLTAEEDNHPKEVGSLELPAPRIPNATQYERSGVPVSEHKGPYHPALHSVHYNSNHSDEEIREEGDNRRHNSNGEEEEDGLEFHGKTHTTTKMAVGEHKAGGREVEGDNEAIGSKGGGEVHVHDDNSGTSRVGPQQGGVTIGGGNQVMSHGDTIGRLSKEETNVMGSKEEHEEGMEHAGHEWHPHRHHRHKGHTNDNGKGKLGHDKVPKEYHPSLHHKAESKATDSDLPMAPPGHRHELEISEVEGEPGYEGTLAEELSSLLSLWTGGGARVSTELQMVNKEGGKWVSNMANGQSSSSSRTKAWLAAAAERYTGDINHQVEGDVMLGKLITFLSLNSMGGPNDLITGSSDPGLGDLRASDSAFICNHVCWQRHPQGFARSSIKGVASLATQCELSPMAAILLGHKKPGLMRAIGKVCDEECMAITVEENSPVSACVEVPCSQRCRVEGNRCTSTLQHDWYADGLCSTKCTPTEGKVCGTKTAPQPKTAYQGSQHTYDSRCLWTRTCDRCLSQEMPPSLPSMGPLTLAADMYCINFDGACRPSRGDGTCSVKKGEESPTNSPSEEFFTCAAPYFEEAYPYGPYYTTVGGKPIKEVKNIRVDWNNHTVAVEAVMHNHRGAPPDCLKARFLVVDEDRERNYRSGNREWQSRICADHWNDRTLPWEADDRPTKGDFDGRVESMFLFKEDQNPTRPASLRVVGEVPLMKAALDRNNVVHFTPDFDDYQLLLCLGPAEGYMSPLGSSALKVISLPLTDDLRETDDGLQRGKEPGDTVEVRWICPLSSAHDLHCSYLRQACTLMAIGDLLYCSMSGAHLPCPSTKVLINNTFAVESCGTASSDMPVSNGGGHSPSSTPRPVSSRLSVCVVGGGIAGATAARELARKGFHVTLFEARDRLGGRLHSPDLCGRAVDVGGSWIHGTNKNPVTEAVNAFGLETYGDEHSVRMWMDNNKGEVPPHIDATVEDVWNKLMDLAPVYADRSSRPSTRSTTSTVDSLGAYISEVYRSVDHHGSDSTPRSNASGPLSAASRELQSLFGSKGKGGLNPQEQELAKELINWHITNIEYSAAAPVWHLSLRHWDQDDPLALDGQHVMLRGGYQQLVERILTDIDRLPGEVDVILNQTVTKIEYEPDTDMTQPPVGVYVNGKSTPLKFHWVILTAPLGVLKASLVMDDLPSMAEEHPRPESVMTKSSKGLISFTPPLSDDKIAVVKRLGMGLLNKVVLAFPNRFWPRGEDNSRYHGFVSGVPGEMFWFVEVSDPPPDRDVVMTDAEQDPDDTFYLVGFLCGEFAIRLAKESDEHIVDLALNTLGRMFGEDTIPTLKGFIVTRWNDDPYSRGSYSYIATESSGLDYDGLMAPEYDGRLLFAGEATCRWYPSTVHGALLSGLREARRICDLVRGEPKLPQIGKLFPGSSTMAGIRLALPGDFELEEDDLAPINDVENQKLLQIHCALCNQKWQRERPMVGPISPINRYFVHVDCALLTPETATSLKPPLARWWNVEAAIKRGQRLICSQCKKPGATISCCYLKGNTYCDAVYHSTCALRLSWPIEEGLCPVAGRPGWSRLPPFYCPEHRQDSPSFNRVP